MADKKSVLDELLGNLDGVIENVKDAEVAKAIKEKGSSLIGGLVDQFDGKASETDDNGEKNQIFETAKEQGTKLIDSLKDMVDGKDADGNQENLLEKVTDGIGNLTKNFNLDDVVGSIGKGASGIGDMIGDVVEDLPNVGKQVGDVFSDIVGGFGKKDDEK